MGANFRTTQPSSVPESTNNGKTVSMSSMSRALLNAHPTSSAPAASTVKPDSANMQAYKQYASQQEFGDQLIQNAVEDQAGGISSVLFSTEGKKRLNMAQQLGIK